MGGMCSGTNTKCMCRRERKKKVQTALFSSYNGLDLHRSVQTVFLASLVGSEVC